MRSKFKNRPTLEVNLKNLYLTELTYNSERRLPSSRLNLLDVGRMINMLFTFAQLKSKRGRRGLPLAAGKGFRLVLKPFSNGYVHK